jgi:hypothetical protein
MQDQGGNQKSYRQPLLHDAKRGANAQNQRYQVAPRVHRFQDFQFHDGTPEYEQMAMRRLLSRIMLSLRSKLSA